MGRDLLPQQTNAGEKEQEESGQKDFPEPDVISPDGIMEPKLEDVPE